MFLVLTVLVALVRIGGGAEARSLATRVPDALSVASEEPGGSTFARLTEEDLASLEDMRGEPLPPENLDGPGGLRADASPLPSRSAPVEAARTGGGGRTAPEAVPEAMPEAEPPVFYRPAGPGGEAASGPVCGDLRGAPAGGRIVFPLEREFFYSYEDTWGAPRAQGGHEGTDLMTPSGVPEYAITDGTVVPVAGSDADGWNSLGGHTVMIRADYSIGPVKAGDLFYYAHLRQESPLEIGDRVSAGQVVGYAGDTGQGPPGTSGLFPPHLHLGWYDGIGGRQEAVSGAMNPYPLLEWIKSNGGAISGGSDARFCEAPRPGPPTPSSGNGPWPTPTSPGLSPDLDADPRDPSPARANKGKREDPAPAKEQNRRERNPAKPPKPDGPGAQKHGRPQADTTEPPRPGGDQPAPPDPAPLNPAPPSDDGAPDAAPPPEDPGNPSNGQYDPATGKPGTTRGNPSAKDRAPEPNQDSAQGRDENDGEPHRAAGAPPDAGR